MSSSSSSSVICQMTDPKPLPKRFLHIVRTRASSFNWQCPLLSLRSSNSFLRLLPRLLFTSICPFIFPSTTCFRKQFLRKMWPIKLAFRFLISCRIFLCLLTVTLLHFSHDRSNWSSPSFSSTTFQNFQGVFKHTNFKKLFDIVTIFLLFSLLLSSAFFFFFCGMYVKYSFSFSHLFPTKSWCSKSFFTGVLRNCDYNTGKESINRYQIRTLKYQITKFFLPKWSLTL